MPLSQTIRTEFGPVFWNVLPAKDHLSLIFAVLSEASCRQISVTDLVRTEAGRPDFSGFGFDANWSHSRDVCLLAYSFDARVGVDIEFERPRTLKIADRFFAEEEKMRLFRSGLLPEAALKEFYRLWCRKEALFKCVGGEFIGGVLSQNLIPASVSGTSITDIAVGLDRACAAAIAVCPKNSV